MTNSLVDKNGVRSERRPSSISVFISAHGRPSLRKKKKHLQLEDVLSWQLQTFISESLITFLAFFHTVYGIGTSAGTKPIKAKSVSFFNSLFFRQSQTLSLFLG